jgi:Zinc carboxypeptidase/Secretion system C-terminal sorting domain
MKAIFIAVVVCGLGFIKTTIGQDTLKYKRITDSLFSKKGEIYFSFSINSKEEIHTLTKVISIDHCSGDIAKNNLVQAYANKKQFYNFLKLKYRYTVLPSPGSLINPIMLDEYDLKQARGMRTFAAYPTYPAYEKLMYKFETDYPDLCKVVNIQTLASGRKLLLLKITDNINTKEDEPQFLYTSSMHGDEVTGYPLMLDLIEYLLSNYKTNPRVANLVNNIEIWINPCANPDGTYKGGNNTVNGATRGNANNVDMNRNYPDPKGGQHPDGEVWQSETKAWMAFADTMNIVMSANFHGGAEVVNYPWDTWSKACADKNWWIQESKLYADTAQAQSPGKTYLDDLYSGSDKGVTQGFPWYEIEGGRQDYMNYFKHCREVTIELSAVKILAEGNLDAHWKYNYRSLLNYMEECLHGVRGIVTDECTGKPVRAKVFISGHDFDSSHVYSGFPIGDYHRPVYAGTYNLEFSAGGYQTKTISGIAVTTGGINIQNVQLKSITPAKPTIKENNGTLYSSALSGNQWYFNGVIINGANSNSYKPSQSGMYTVVATNCGSGTSNPYNFITNGLNELQQSEISIYPNPSDGKFIISGNGMNVSKLHIQVYNILGKLVQDEEVRPGNTPYLFDLGDMPEGIYMAKMSTQESTYTRKLIVKK